MLSYSINNVILNSSNSTTRPTLGIQILGLIWRYNDAVFLFIAING